MPVADLSQARQELVVRDDVAALALDRLDEDGRELVRWHEALEDALLELVEAGAAVGHVVDTGHQRPEAGVVLGLRPGQRDGAVGPAVEGAQEGDHVLAPGVEARQLERRLDDLRTRVAQEDADLARHRRDPGQGGRGMGVDGQVEVGGAEVQQVGRLLGDDLDDPLVAVARRVDGDAGGEVEEEVAVDVLDRQAVAADRHDGVGARKAGRGDRLIEGDVLAGPGARAAR